MINGKMIELIQNEDGTTNIRGMLLQKGKDGYSLQDAIHGLTVYIRDTIDNESTILLNQTPEYKATRSASFDTGYIEGLGHVFLRLEAILDVIKGDK